VDVSVGAGVETVVAAASPGAGAFSGETEQARSAADVTQEKTPVAALVRLTRPSRAETIDVS
jgi:hypothetical protein